MSARARNLTPDFSEPIAESTFAAVYRMSKSQLLIGWGVVGLMLVVVFLFGFYSGRKQGVELALTEQSVPRLRLPVESPKARAALATTPLTPSAAAESNTSPATKFDFTDSRTDSFAINTHQDSNSETVVLAPKQETNVDPSAGFVAKAASAVVIQPTEPKKEVVSNLEPVLATLADRVAKVEMSPSLGQNLAKVEKPGPKLEDAIKDTAVKILPPTGSKAISKESKLVPATPAKKTSAPAIKVDSVPASGLFVQVGAPDSFAKAQSMVTNLKARGITAAIRGAIS